MLPAYDAALQLRELELFPQWYLVTRHRGVAIDDTMRRTLDQAFEVIAAECLAWPSVFVHSDFMPRNLMLPTVTAGRPVETRMGVLDFQDAVYGPITYDIASLMRDAFLSWEEDFVLDVTIRYWEKARAAGLPVGPDFGAFYRGVEWMGLQRHLRVTGIFARLTLRDGKPRYLADTPRFIGYIRATCERYRELKPLLRLVDKVEGIEDAGAFVVGGSDPVVSAGRTTDPARDHVPDAPLLLPGGTRRVARHRPAGRCGTPCPGAAPAAGRTDHAVRRQCPPGDGTPALAAAPPGGGEFEATVAEMGRNDVRVHVGRHHAVEREPARQLHLAIGMPANERMDWLVEKATELGAASVQALMTERTVVRLDGERAHKKCRPLAQHRGGCLRTVWPQPGAAGSGRIAAAPVAGAAWASSPVPPGGNCCCRFAQAPARCRTCCATRGLAGGC